MVKRKTKSKRSSKAASKALPKAAFDKYAYYLNAVQTPDTEVRLLRSIYRDFSSREPLSLREDFTGTAALCHSWVMLGKEKKAWGVDLDPEPIAYGKKNLLKDLPEQAQKRVVTIRENVITGRLPTADIICALNFSYFCLRTRRDVLAYFKRCRRDVKKHGVFIIDVIGGPAYEDVHEEKSRKSGFWYHWNQASFNQITRESTFHIHFTPFGGRKRNKVFSYEWRMWTLPELRDILHDAGFKKSVVYWEGFNRQGLGSGVYRPSEKGDDATGWVAYIAAIP